MATLSRLRQNHDAPILIRKVWTVIERICAARRRLAERFWSRIVVPCQAETRQSDCGIDILRRIEKSEINELVSVVPGVRGRSCEFDLRRPQVPRGVVVDGPRQLQHVE